MREDSNAVKAGWLNFCQDALLLLHPVVAIGFAVVRLTIDYEGGGPASHLDDLFFRRSLKVYDAFRFSFTAPPGSLFPDPACCRPLGFLGGVALQVTFLTSCVCFAVLAVVATRALAPAKVSRAILHPSVALAGLLGWLVCWWRVSLGPPAGGWLWCYYLPAMWLAWLLLVSTAIIGYLVVRRARMTYSAVFTYGGFFILHFGFWFVTFAHRVFWLPMVLVSAAVAGKGVFWLSRMRHDAQGESRQISQGFMLVIALVSLGILLLIWLPPKTYSIAHSREMRSLIVRLQRGGGSGGAPAYSITVYGDGKVTYFGERLVAVRGSRTVFIRPDQVQSLTEKLDHIGFFGVEDRTFADCADAPTTLISVSIDGRKKTVFSEPCLEVETGPLAEVLKVAQEIDSTVGSDQWTRCNRPCWR